MGYGLCGTGGKTNKPLVGIVNSNPPLHDPSQASVRPYVTQSKLAESMPWEKEKEWSCGGSSPHVNINPETPQNVVRDLGRRWREHDESGGPLIFDHLYIPPGPTPLSTWATTHVPSVTNDIPFGKIGEAYDCMLPLILGAAMYLLGRTLYDMK